MTRSNVLALLAAFIGLVMTARCSYAATLRVPADYPRIQDAIDQASPGDVVLVSKGRYKENVNFHRKSVILKSLYETDPTAVGETIIDGDGKGSVVSLADGEPDTAVLAGFTLENGTGSGWWGYPPCGGGVYLWNASATVRDNVIRNCTSFAGGGGIYCHLGRPLVVGNIITGCTTSYFGGGGILCNRQTEAVIVNNEISGNTAISGSGGGILVEGSSPTIQGNRIFSNSAAYNGGGVDCNGNAQLIGNTVRNNTAPSGGGILCAWGEQRVSNNLIYGNTSSFGGGIGFIGASAVVENNTIVGNNATSGGGISIAHATLTLNGNIIASSLAGGGISLYAGNAPTISYCNAYGNQGGNYQGMRNQTGKNGNINADPLFADTSRGDYHLRSCAGRWSDPDKRFVQDHVTSPCIDAGDPASAFSIEPTPNGGRANMGAEGNTAYASKSAVPTVISWGPKGTAVGIAGNIIVTFSLDMVRPTAQAALLINGVKATDFGGTFTWKGPKMTFNPTHHLQPGTDYRITIGKRACSKAGATMAKSLTWTFTTQPAAAAVVTVASAPTAAGAQITLSLTAAADVTLSIRNVAGREVAVLTPGQLEAGVQSLVWNGKSKMGTRVPSGMYLLQANARAADGSSSSALTSLRR